MEVWELLAPEAGYSNPACLLSCWGEGNITGPRFGWGTSCMLPTEPTMLPNKTFDCWGEGQQTQAFPFAFVFSQPSSLNASEGKRNGGEKLPKNQMQPRDTAGN